MASFIKYKDYYGLVEYSADDRTFWGKLAFINDLITFEADNVDDLEKEFRIAVDDYLETCEEVGKEPQKPFKGSFNVRIQPELHMKAALESLKENISLNKFVENAIDHELSLKNA